ncbi:hypothetical protein T4E_6381 [Trichinella pseudospiralis]|uniref:Uncharacterized protein n=1 Tax=Trichinella pseudospiralis TaxID=6337 RepID=A0A0V0XFU7_TRIPS|nr:hypothetical protein T4E_6381 [Trichinella pseudospiralis]
MVNSVWCACNVDSSSFLDDSEEMMDATKRIVCCCSQAFVRRGRWIYTIPFSVDGMLLIENAYGL